MLALSLSVSPLSCCRDLKRDVAKKLERLERRTQRAIAELIRKCSGQRGPALRAVASTQAFTSCLLFIQVNG